MKILKIKTTTSAYQMYQILRLISLVIISILLVKLSFSREETSVFELFLFIVNISTFFWTMGISNSILAYYPKLDNNLQKKFLFNIFFLLQVTGLLIAATIFVSKGFGLINSEILSNTSGLILVSLYVFFYSPTLLIEINYILNKQPDKLFWYGIIVFGLQFLIISISAIIFKDIYIVLESLTFWIIIRWIWTLKIIFNNTANKKISIELIKVFIIFSAPVIIHILLGNGMEYIDGLIVNRFFDPGIFSIYRYGAREFPIILILIGALRSTMIPEAVEDITKATAKIKEQTSKIIKYFFPIAIILMLSSKYLYTFFYSEEYIYSALLFNIYLLIITSRIIMPEVFIYAQGMNNVFVKISLAEIITNIILSLILIRFWGIAGIAFATFVTFMIFKLVLVFFVKSKIKIPPGKYLDMKLYFTYSFLLFLSFIISIRYI